MSHSDRMQYPSHNLVWAGRAIISVLLMDPMKAAPYIWSRRLRRKVAGRKTDNQWESVRFVVAHYWVNAKNIQSCRAVWWLVASTLDLHTTACSEYGLLHVYIASQKNKKLNSCLQLHQILTDFQIFSLPDSVVTFQQLTSCLNISANLQYAATLPCEIWMSENWR